MSEFFIRKPFRRAGIGRDAATLIFDRFAGHWEIVEYHRNPGLRGILEARAVDVLQPGYTEKPRHGEVRQRFTSRPAAAR